MRPLHAVVMGAVGLSLAAAGCGGAIPSSDGGPATLRITGSAQGRHLADQAGRSVYLFEKDESRESYCNGACAAVWPAVETSSKPRAGAGIRSGVLGTIERDDGDRQVTYHGHPLYYYAGDAGTPGKTRGQEQKQFGSEWYLVDSSGKPLESETPSKPSSNTGSGNGSGNGGGGYP